MLNRHRDRPPTGPQRQSLAHPGFTITGHLTATHMGRLIINMPSEDIFNELSALYHLRHHTRLEILQMRDLMAHEAATSIAATGLPNYTSRPGRARQLLLRLDREARFSRTLVHLMQELLLRDPDALFDGPIP